MSYKEKFAALDTFLVSLGKKAEQDGYPPDIVRNMQHHPEMVDIIIRMVGAELEAVRKERISSGNNSVETH